MTWLIAPLMSGQVDVADGFIQLGRRGRVAHECAHSRAEQGMVVGQQALDRLGHCKSSALGPYVVVGIATGSETWMHVP